MSLERAYLNFNDFNGAMPHSLCTLREDGSLKDLWSDCGGYPITCTCCTVCCDMVAECNEMDSQREKGGLQVDGDANVQMWKGKEVLIKERKYSYSFTYDSSPIAVLHFQI